METFDKNFRVLAERQEFMIDRIKKIEEKLDELDKIKARIRARIRDSKKI